MTFKEEHFNRFCDFVLDGTEGCMEFICFNAVLDYKTNLVIPSKVPGLTVGGYVTDRRRLRDFARRLEGVSAYVTINPVHPDFMAVSGNNLTRLAKDKETKEGGAAKAKDITSIKFVYIDIDVDRGNSKISATLTELEESMAVRNRILDSMPEIRDNSLSGCSGNGAWILLRIEEHPNTPRTTKTVKELLEYLAVGFGAKGKSKAHIDINTHFPNIHVGLPGTLKCKGTPTDARPWRLVTVDAGF